jgi:hypothetical protein
MLAAVADVRDRVDKGYSCKISTIASKHGIPCSSLRAQLKKSDPLQISARGPKPVLHGAKRAGRTSRRRGRKRRRRRRRRRRRGGRRRRREWR